MDIKKSLPVLPLRDIVVFPNMVIPLFVGRDKSITALNEVMKNDKKIVLVTQKNSEVDEPKNNDIFSVGFWLASLLFYPRLLGRKQFSSLGGMACRSGHRCERQNVSAMKV